MIMDDFENYGFEQSVEFFSKYGGVDYVSPENAGNKSNYMSNIYRQGQMARENFKNFIEKIADSFDGELLICKKSDCHGWHEMAGPGKFRVKSYLWIEVKNPKWEDSVQSISLDFGGNNRLDVRVDIKQTDERVSDPVFKQNVLHQQMHLVDLPLQDGLAFRTLTLDKNHDYAEYGQSELDNLKAKLLSNTDNLPLVQVGTSLDSLVEREKAGTLLADAIRAVRAIKTYYDYVMSLAENADENSNKSGVRKYWLYSMDENASYWDEFYSATTIAIGWDHIGAIVNYKTQESIENALLETGESNSALNLIAKTLWQFANEMQVGDVVYVKKGASLIMGKGIVTSDYSFEQERNELKNVRKIKWLYKGELPNQGASIRKTLTEISLHDAEKIDELFDRKLQFKNVLSWMLYESKNMILRGAPGTGKSYLAKNIAADIISSGSCADYDELSEEQKKQVEFVQFHPNYDYSDFVEGLRPIQKDDGTIGFKLMNGIFKGFIECARKNYEDSLKPLNVIEKENSVKESIEEFFSNIELEKDTFKISSGNEFSITHIDDKDIDIYIPKNSICKTIQVRKDELEKMLETDIQFVKPSDLTVFFGKNWTSQKYSYLLALYNEIKAKYKERKNSTAQLTVKKNYVFIIDEINRGEISKIFGELFFAIDPGYRGPKGMISTQYANMHDDPEKKFYIPDNVYIIGTMNDIDRSVDSFDFAMRRRFRFVELKASEHLKMLDSLNDDVKAEAIHRMTELNNAIIKENELNENYQIGAAYFLKLKYLSFDRLWTDYLEPLLQEYVRGMYDESDIMKRLAKAYGYNPTEGDADESDQN